MGLVAWIDHANVVLFYIYDGRGSVTGLTNASGQIVRRYEFDAFGVERNPSDNDRNPWRFNAEYFDRATGTIYMRFRDFAPWLGRFLTEDPIRWGLNWYVFAVNNPVFYTDPWGLFEFNEDSDHLFVIAYEVEKAGGTVDHWCASTGTVTVTVFGETMTFTEGQMGTHINSDNRMVVRADTFYRRLIGSAGREMIFLTSHTAFDAIQRHLPTDFQHATVVIFINFNHPLYGTDDFIANGTRWGGIRYATIGGTSENGFVIGTTTSVTDRDLSTKRGWLHISSGRGMAANLFAANNFYNRVNPERFGYVPVPIRGESTFNSGSYLHGLLRAVFRRDFPEPHNNSPGWGLPIGAEYFGRMPMRGS